MTKTRNVVLMLAFFLFLSIPSFAGAQTVTATPDDCSSVDLPVCEQLFFMGETNDGGFAMIVVQRAEFDTPEDMIMSDLFLTTYIDGLNSGGTDLFVPAGDATAEVLDEGYFEDIENVRVLVGTSDLIENDQPSLMIVVADGESTYVFLAFGEVAGFLSYAEEVVEESDVTITPEDFLPVDINAMVVTNNLR